MPTDLPPDDDATRIYRPYGSPPPEPSPPESVPAGSVPADPWTAPHDRSPAVPLPDTDPWAPETQPAPPVPASTDPWATPSPVPGYDPFRPLPPSEPSAAPTDSPRAADPFESLPIPPSAPSPTPPVHASFQPTPPPYVPPPASDPFAVPTSVGPPPSVHPAVSPRAADPFAAPARDPFTVPDKRAPVARDPFDSGFASPAVRPTAAMPDMAMVGGRLADAFASVFALVLQLRTTSDFGDPATLRQRAEALIDQSAERARAAGADAAEVREAEFCLVAFLDEAVMTSEWPGRDAWAAHPLQLSRYDRYDAGEAFFDRLKQLFGEQGRDEVLEVYYLCLALGFKGRYQIHGREVLRQLVDELQSRLARAPGGSAGPLAPHALPRGPAAEAQASGFPTWALFVGAALLAVLLYLGFSLSVSSIARDVATDVQALSDDSSSR